MTRTGFWVALPLVLAACGGKPASAPTPAAAAPARPPQMSPEEMDWTFRKIVQRHQTYWLTPGKCGTFSGWFSQEWTTYRTDGRLFARAYPGPAERLALEVLRDPEAPAPDRHYAWFVLGCLAPQSSPALERFITDRIASVDGDYEDRYEAELALSNLAERRFDERCLALCRAEYRKANSTAFDLISQVVDPESIRLLQELKRWDEEAPYPVGRIAGLAQDALRRISILQAKDWEQKIEGILLGWREDPHSWDLHWALAVARRQGMSTLQSVLEKRLNEGRLAGEPLAVSAGYPQDYDFDAILVAYARAGGALRPKEEMYLRDYGFGGDSEARLIELMALRGQYGR